jgi:fructokinase
MFVICREALWDLFAEKTGGDLTFRARIGGSPFNMAVGLARLGVDAGLMTGLSTDDLGARLDEAPAREGVSRDLPQRVPRRITLWLVDIAEDDRAGGGTAAGDSGSERAPERAPERGA